MRPGLNLTPSSGLIVRLAVREAETERRRSMIYSASPRVTGLMVAASLSSFAPDAPSRRPGPAIRRLTAGRADSNLSAAPTSVTAEGLLRLIGEQRDRAAFSLLFRQFAPRIRAYALRMGASGASAEELVQEVMLSVWRAADRYDPGKANAATWIYAITRNRLLDEFRRAPPPTVELEAAWDEPGDDPTHERRIDSERAAQRLRAAVESLPAEQAEVLRIAYYEGLSQRDMAARLGLPLGTVKSRTRLALDRLRAALAHET